MSHQLNNAFNDQKLSKLKPRIRVGTITKNRWDYKQAFSKNNYQKSSKLIRQ